MTKSKPEESEAARTTILFADLIGSTDYASMHDNQQYKESLIDEYHKMLNEIFDRFDPTNLRSPLSSTQRFYVNRSVRGDEGVFAIGLNPNDTEDPDESSRIQDAISCILSIAFSIKHEWLTHEINKTRLADHRPPFDIAIGINTGDVFWIRTPGASAASCYPGDTSPPRIEGYAISLAKRIESQSRKGEYSGVFVGENTYGYYFGTPGEDVVRFRQQAKSELKGITGSVRIYEVVYAGIEDEVYETPETQELLGFERLDVVRFPSDWYQDGDRFKELTKDTMEESGEFELLKRHFYSFHNPWHGNIICNFLWKRFAYLYDLVLTAEREWSEDERVEAELLLRSGIIPVSQKLIQIDAETDIWKVNYGQAWYDLVSMLDIEELKPGDFHAVREVVEVLERVSRACPFELDGRLLLGKFCLFLLMEYSFEAVFRKRDYGDDWDSHWREKAIDEFQRILVWDKKFQRSYVYLAVASYRKEMDIETSLRFLKDLDVNCSPSQKEIIAWRDELSRDRLFGRLRENEKFNTFLRNWKATR